MTDKISPDTSGPDTASQSAHLKPSARQIRIADAFAQFFDRRERLRQDDTRRSGKARSWLEKLLVRALSGVIYAALHVACLYLGTIPTAILIALESWLCCSEMLHMMRLAGRMPNEIIALSAALAFPLCALLPPPYTTLVILALAASCAIWFVSYPLANITDVALTIFVPLYTGFLFSSIVSIRGFNNGWRGALLALGTLGSIWANDSMAFFLGSRFGKTKLAPKISPNKTWEGFLGGMLGSVAVWLIIWTTHITSISLGLALIAGVVVGVSAVLGDLFESRIKRGVGVKDSGDLMPGHGGLLDRSDSLLFGCEAAEFILMIGGIL